MSEMEFFHGYFEKASDGLEYEDADDFHDLEEAHGCHYVEVDGQLYRFWGSDIDVDPYGFNVVVPPTDRQQLMLYWYNGGAGIHEVAESAIKEWLDKQK